MTEIVISQLAGGFGAISGIFAHQYCVLITYNTTMHWISITAVHLLTCLLIHLC